MLTRNHEEHVLMAAVAYDVKDKLVRETLEEEVLTEVVDPRAGRIRDTRFLNFRRNGFMVRKTDTRQILPKASESRSSDNKWLCHSVLRDHAL